jgi:hypothetical protein
MQFLVTDEKRDHGSIPFMVERERPLSPRYIGFCHTINQSLL